MATNVYCTNTSQAAASLILFGDGPSSSSSSQFTNLAGQSNPSGKVERLLSVNRSPVAGDYTTITELAFSIGSEFMVALVVMLTTSMSIVKNEIAWAWRAPLEDIGKFVDDHNVQSVTVSVAGCEYTFTVQGQPTVGFDDIYLTISSVVNRDRWMEALAGKIGNVPLNEIRIPGSHDSGTSSITAASDWAPDSSWWHALAPQIVASWAKTQAVGIAQQLMDGIRYFDFRVAPTANTPGSYSLVHSLQGDDVQTTLAAIGNFLATHPKEIIILDINKLYSMTPADHTDLVGIILATIGVYLVSPRLGVNVTPNTLWSTQQRVIVAYANDHIVSLYPQVLWAREHGSTSRISSPYPETNDINVLHTFLTTVLQNRTTSKFFVLQGILTVQTSFFPLFSTLEAWAKSTTNPEVASWITQEWAKSNPNIIMVDFYSDNDIIGLIIGLNE